MHLNRKIGDSRSMCGIATETTILFTKCRVIRQDILSRRLPRVGVVPEAEHPLSDKWEERTDTPMVVHSPSRSQSRTLTTLIPSSFPSPKRSMVRTVFPKLSLMAPSDLNSLSRVSSDIIVRQTW